MSLEIKEEDLQEIPESEETAAADPKFDPRQVEEDMIKIAQERAMDPSEMASNAYGMYIPHYKRLVSKLSTRGLRRLLNYLVLYPFEVDDVKAATELEKQLMQVSNSLIEAKFVMIMNEYNKNAELLQNSETSELTAEEELEVIEEFRKRGVSEEEIQKMVSARAVDNTKETVVE